MNFAFRAAGVFFLIQFFSCVFNDESCATKCSNFYEPVCGLAISKDGTSITKKFHNVCHLMKIRCRLKPLVDIKQVLDHHCNLPASRNGRRVHDFDIVGAHKSCNHTCPTYCRDTYDPACAQIWKPKMDGFTTRVMINHCHIDMYSCIMAVIFSCVFNDESCATKCSNFYEPVCGLAISKDGTSITKKFHNVCHLMKIRCRLKPLVDIKQVLDHHCNLPASRNGRRVHDFDIVGAHKSCNHTCPTYCRDTYDPACAQIWKPKMDGFTTRVMINHCHIDMYSCIMAVNVSIQPLSKCFKNPTGLVFMTHIAAMKSLKLIDE